MIPGAGSSSGGSTGGGVGNHGGHLGKDTQGGQDLGGSGGATGWIWML